MSSKSKSKSKSGGRPKQAEPKPAPRLYLMTPRVADADAFAADLERALHVGDIAAVLIRLAPADERGMIENAKTLGAIAQGHGVAALLDGHMDLVARAGADGSHGAGSIDFGEAIERLKPDRIVGAGGLATRHDAMAAAEAGADYVMFGEPDEGGTRPRFEAVIERVVWWAEVFEAPCVGYAASADEVAPLVQAGADFVALGDWIWAGAAETVIATAAQAMRLPETAS